MSVGGWRLTASDPLALSLGLMPGDLLADARARVPNVEAASANPKDDNAELVILARRCTRFSPYVAPWPVAEQSDGAGGLTLDVTGCAHLFGGEEPMVRAMTAFFSRFHLTPRIAISRTIGVAHAVARFGSPDQQIVLDGAEQDAISNLVVGALRIPVQIATTLRSVGLKKIGDLIKLPRAPLNARFGKILLHRLDQALGHAPESFSPLLPARPYRASIVLAEPISSQNHVLELARKLANDLKPMLERDGKGARIYAFTLFRVDGDISELDVRLASPSRDVEHFAKLLSFKLDAIADDFDAGFGFEAARLDVIETGDIQASQSEIGDTPSQSDDKLSILIDRLGSRLGVENIVRFHPRDTHIPERAVVFKPASLAKMQSWDELEPPSRPLFILPAAEEAEVTALLPEGPPLQFRWRGVRYVVARADGPERIRPEWWIPGGKSKTRDYYAIEDSDGRRFWLYRDGPYGAPAPKWFVHGVFA